MRVKGWAAGEPGAVLEPYEWEMEAPGPHQCVVEVTHCGICHSDIHMIDDDWGISAYPLVPGHEVVGRVVEVGPCVENVAVGERVGIGWQGSSCHVCPDCVSGNENLCDANGGLIVGSHGGFADHVLVDARFAFPIPEGIASPQAGPLLCGGVTVYAALRAAGMGSGGRIGVLGVGGLGHMAVLFASKLGNHVTVFTSSEDKARLADGLGAHEAVVVRPGEEPPRLPYRLDILLNTVALPLPWDAWLGLLGSDGTLALVAGPPEEKLEFSFFQLLSKRRRILASPIGGRAVMGEMLEIAARHGVEPLVEVFPMDRVNDALAHVRANRVRYRAVLER